MITVYIILFMLGCIFSNKLFSYSSDDKMWKYKLMLSKIELELRKDPDWDKEEYRYDWGDGKIEIYNKFHRHIRTIFGPTWKQKMQQFNRQLEWMQDCRKTWLNYLMIPPPIYTGADDENFEAAKNYLHRYIDAKCEYYRSNVNIDLFLKGCNPVESDYFFS